MLIFSPDDWEVRANCALKNGLAQSNDMQAEFGIPESTYTALCTPVEGKKYNTLEFAESVPLSTYLYCFIAGPYDVFTPKTEDPDLAVPLGLLCRKSMSKYTEVAAEDWFRVTRAGIKYYEKMF